MGEEEGGGGGRGGRKGWRVGRKEGVPVEKGEEGGGGVQGGRNERRKEGKGRG